MPRLLVTLRLGGTCYVSEIGKSLNESKVKIHDRELLILISKGSPKTHTGSFRILSNGRGETQTPTKQNDYYKINDTGKTLWYFC